MIQDHPSVQESLRAIKKSHKPRPVPLSHTHTHIHMHRSMLKQDRIPINKLSLTKPPSLIKSECHNTDRRPTARLQQQEELTGELAFVIKY